MDNENTVLQRLKSRFNELNSQEAAVSKHRIFLEVPAEICMELIRYAKEELGFGHLSTITGLDDGERFMVIYHLSCDDGIVLNIKLPVPKTDPVIASVLPVYAGAVFYELEVKGLLGIRVDGLPDQRQYPLPDNWPKGQYPMRKDWKPETTQDKG